MTPTIKVLAKDVTEKATDYNLEYSGFANEKEMNNYIAGLEDGSIPCAYRSAAGNIGYICGLVGLKLWVLIKNN